MFQKVKCIPELFDFSSGKKQFINRITKAFKKPLVVNTKMGEYKPHISFKYDKL